MNIYTGGIDPNQEGGNIFKQIITGSIGGLVKSKSKGATDDAIQGALITLADTLKKGRRVKQQKGRGKVRDKISGILKRGKARIVYYKPTNIVRRGTRSLTNAALDGVFDSALTRVQAMQKGGGVVGELLAGLGSTIAGTTVSASLRAAKRAGFKRAAKSRPARKVSSMAAFSRKHRGKLEKGLDFLEKVGSRIDTWQRGGASVIAAPWVFKTVDPTMTGAVLNNALNRLSTSDRMSAIEMLKRGHKY